MSGWECLVLRPWIRDLILGSETLSSPRFGQLLKVLQDSETPGPSSAPDIPDSGAVLLVSDGTHSVRCLVTRNAIDSSGWVEKEFGFCGTEGRILLLLACGVRIEVPQDHTPAEFYLQVDRFKLLPAEQPRLQVTSCNQDSEVQRKLSECLDIPCFAQAHATGGKRYQCQPSVSRGCISPWAGRQLPASTRRLLILSKTSGSQFHTPQFYTQPPTPDL
ncbi:Adrenocortical dysplasia protein [Microtus ochrogaster]|uniref:Adrenocortical dysplasia protein n=1 Tax=Microtus ochrogaster TaxID=79684 RepID=A0A8J6L3L2_MICOH|nr:Adrenocortical dysplasia protein [Microtus ochrogaster]